LSEPIDEAKVDHAILVGEEMAPLARELGKGVVSSLGIPPSFTHCIGPVDAIAALEEYGVTHGDAILIKGSNSVGLGRLVEHFASRDEDQDA